MVLLPIADIGDKPSTSTPQKRPSPNSNDHQLTSKRLNASLPSPSSILHKSSLSVTNQSAIEVAAAGDAVENESDEMDVLAAFVSHQSRSIEKCTSNIDAMCIDSKLTANDFMTEFEREWLPTMESNITDRIETAADTSCTKSAQRKCTKFNSDSVRLYQEPFKICVMSDFLENGSFTRQLVDEMCGMDWHRKQMDLYEFHQTTDLANVSDTVMPALKQFYSLLSTKMLPWMRQITGLALTRVSASCSMYNYGDYLLVHDDLLSDRQIAFVYYLSPWMVEWTDQMGGALELFESDASTGQPKYPIVEKFPPRNNQFVFFRVCKNSFHQVGEITNHVYPRLTINGWFHGSMNHAEMMSMADSIEELHGGSDTEHNSMEVNTGGVRRHPAYQMATESNDLDLNEWINNYYLRRRLKTSIQQHIEDKSEASLEMFLIAEFFDTLSTEFKSPDLDWRLEGPANQRKYDRLHFAANATGPLKDLYTLFTSESIFELLHEYTDLDLSGLNADTATCSVQLCRFGQGCYTLLGDSTTFADSALDVILFFNARDGVGKVTYLSPNGSSHGGVSTEYNTTAETDITTATTNSTAPNTFASTHVTDQSSIASSDISSTSSITLITKSSSNQHASKAPKPSIKSKKSDQPQKHASSSTNNSSSPQQCMDTSDDDVGTDDMQASSTKQPKSSNSAASNNARKVTVRAEIHGHNSDSELNSSQYTEGIQRDDDDSDSENGEYDELAQEDALLTIHPKNNSLNLVYRRSGEAKFVKYISKNSLKPDEYIYILFASYKE